MATCNCNGNCRKYGSCAGPDTLVIRKAGCHMTFNEYKHWLDGYM